MLYYTLYSDLQAGKLNQDRRTCSIIDSLFIFVTGVNLSYYEIHLFNRYQQAH